jgi:hypothetical protein
MTKTKTENRINIISYNLKYHRASAELAGLVENTPPTCYVSRNATATNCRLS